MFVSPVRQRARGRSVVALAAVAGVLAAATPIAVLSPARTAQAVGVQQIAFEANPVPGLVVLGDLASRTERKPVTRAGLGPFTISGTDTRTSSPYSFVTDRPYNPTTRPAYGNEGDEGAVSTQFTSTIDNVATDPVDSDRTGVLKLFSDTNCVNQNVLAGVDGYCSLFGPEIWSEPFDATLGQSVSFDWRATGASDDYEIYAFLVAVDEINSSDTYDYGDEAAHTLLAYGRGRIQAWTSASSPVPAAGSYRFRFVNGSYDGTGGLALGSEMYIDSVVRVGQSNPITFPQPGDQIAGAGPFALNASSPAGQVTYTSATPTKCTVSGNTVTLVGSALGVCTIVADQAGDGVNYVQANSVSRSFTILAAATAPANYGVPVINGALALGQILTATEGTWGDGGSPITATVMQWEATNGATTTDITASGSGCYLVPSPGTTLRVRVTQTNAIGSTTATSAATLAGYTCGTPPAPAADLSLGLTPGAATGTSAAQATGTGSGLLPNSTYTITLQPGGTILGTGTVGNDGTFQSTVTVPSGLAEGAYELALDGTALDGSPIGDSGWFSVTADGTIGDVSDSGPIDLNPDPEPEPNPDPNPNPNPNPNPGDGGFVGVAPARLVDTRGEGGQVSAGTIRELVVVGRNGVPGDASAVVLNVTVSNPLAAGHLTIFPCDSTMPLASNLNYAAGETIANAVTVQTGTASSVCVYSSADADLVVDVTGAYSATAGAGLLRGLIPARLYDSRLDDGERVAAGTVHQVVVTGQGGVAADATSVVLSVTATEPLAEGFATVFPCGSDTPLASNLNYAAGQTVANTVFTAVGAGGAVCIFTSADTHLVVDVNGDYAPDRTAGHLESTMIERLVDTRESSGPTAGAKVAAGQVVEVAVVDHAGVSVESTAVTLNVAAVDPESIGFLTVFPCGGELPLASNVNFAAGQTVSNAVTTAIGAGGTVCIFTLATAHIVVDANASYGVAV